MTQPKAHQGTDEITYQRPEIPSGSDHEPLLLRMKVGQKHNAAVEKPRLHTGWQPKSEVELCENIWKNGVAHAENMDDMMEKLLEAALDTKTKARYEKK